jgi:hypothetical protein
LKSDQLDKLAPALCRAQGKIKHAVKDSKNPFFKSNYADLTSVWDAIRDAFQAEGLSVSQLPTTDDDGRPALETILMHASGQWISGVVPVNPVKNDPQALGSAITYMRRYALQAVAGVCADDDDGEAAQGRKKVNSSGEHVPKKPAWTDDQKKRAGEAKAAYVKAGGSDTDMDEVWRKHAYDPAETCIMAMNELAMELDPNFTPKPPKE